MNVLIVEDQTTDILGTYELLWHLGHKVTLAFDGEQGLIEIHRGEYDLLILDWNLPIISGKDLIEKIESISGLKRRNLPMKVILHSGGSFRLGDFEDYVNIEFLDVWKKPMRASEILKRLKKITDQSQRIA